MIKLNKDFLIKFLILLGIISSFFLLISVKSENNSLSFSIHPSLNFSVIDIAMEESLETLYYSNFLGILFYLVAIILIVSGLKKLFFIHYFTFFFLVILLLFDIYYIYLVKAENFTGQHLRISVPLFLLVFYSYRSNRSFC